ncbi:MAG: hypothetical protein LBC02_09685 [Planctomycetaceae bacterium]|jgi:hypothetical protein|nr:hypothetical protein [Planctomycetaceae bacterium]
MPYFVVPYQITERKDNKVAIQVDYRQMWENIKKAADATNMQEELKIKFK